MFESAFIDRFSRTPWLLVPAVYLPAAALLAWWGVQGGVGALSSVGLFAGGWVVWSLTEYWLHRTFFHWQPPGRVGEAMHFIVHGVHHKWPRDRYRLVMPIAVSLALFWIFLGIFWALLGELAWSFHAGFTFGYMFYDVSHYLMHHTNPRIEWFRRLRKHHLIHHSPRHGVDCKFGVSTTVWDHVFRTYDQAAEGS